MVIDGALKNCDNRLLLGSTGSDFDPFEPGLVEKSRRVFSSMPKCLWNKQKL